jgi:hypothetical protein
MVRESDLLNYGAHGANKIQDGESKQRAIEGISDMLTDGDKEVQTASANALIQLTSLGEICSRTRYIS